MLNLLKSFDEQLIRQRYKNQHLLLDDLGASKEDAFVYLHLCVWPSCKKHGRKFNIHESYCYDVFMEELMKFVDKIKKNEVEAIALESYFFNGYKNRFLNEQRNRYRHEVSFIERIKSKFYPLPNKETFEKEMDKSYDRQEFWKIVENELCEECQNIIKADMLDGMSLNDMLSNNITNRKTYDSLKNRKSQCMKKLKSRIIANKKKFL